MNCLTQEMKCSVTFKGEYYSINLFHLLQFGDELNGIDYPVSKKVWSGCFY